MLLLPDRCYVRHDSAFLVRWQSTNDFLHLRISVNSEALVLGHTRQLHILAVQLLLHDLLQSLEHQNLRLRQGKRLVELVLQLCLRALGAGSNSFGIVAVEGTGRFGVVPRSRVLDNALGTARDDLCDVQTWTVLIITCNQQRHTKRPTHDALLSLCTLTKPQRQVAYRLGAALDSQRLVVVESVVLTLDTRVLNHASCIGLQARHGASNVAIDFDNLLDGAGLEER
jgi:hypothetical protein